MRVSQLFGSVVVVFLVLLQSGFALDPGQTVNMTDPCYTNVPAVRIYFTNETLDMVDNFGVVNTCSDGTSVRWVDPIDLSILGPVTDDQVVVTKTSIFVDSALRPDLDAPATLIFKKIPFAVEPEVLRDDFPCGDCVVTFDPTDNDLYVSVTGFSNYSLSGRKDFIVYSDTQPEMDKKVYQTIDLGDVNRATEYSCIVQIFGQSASNPGQWVLVQTNPQREVQARLLGNPDQNQPESLGYFRTTGGMANVYFRDQNIPGYSDFEYVAQCSSNSTKLIYEEPISTRYHPMGRTAVSRGVWMTDGNNMYFLVAYALGGLVIVWILWVVIRKTFG